MPLRILVVDDHRDTADSLAELLSLMGYETRVAYDGLTALSIASAMRPALVMLDLAMPGLDGYEVARRLRGTEASLILVAVTGYGQQADVERFLKEGFKCSLRIVGETRARIQSVNSELLRRRELLAELNLRSLGLSTRAGPWSRGGSETTAW